LSKILIAKELCWVSRDLVPTSLTTAVNCLSPVLSVPSAGVVIISHHNEFTSALCPEKWSVANGQVTVTGAPQVLTKEKVEFKVQEEVTDAFGNTIKVKGPKKELSRKEKKAKAKERAARRARGEEVSESEDEL
jgi:elongation factor 3